MFFRGVDTTNQYAIQTPAPGWKLGRSYRELKLRATPVAIAPHQWKGPVILFALMWISEIPMFVRISPLWIAYIVNQHLLNQFDTIPHYH